MKKFNFLSFLLFLVVGLSCLAPKENKEVHSGIVNKVDPSLFLSKEGNLTISTVTCTLSTGAKTNCYEIISNSQPSDHVMGPWCPDNISDGPEAGGIWMKDGEVYDVDGAFIKGMAKLYQDEKWLMYDSNGDIYKTKTKEDCANAANPAVGEEYANFCVECLPAYILDMKQTYLIPVTPIRLETATSFGGGGPGGKGGPPPNGKGKRPEGDRPKGPPPGKANGPQVRGLAFNGIRFDGPAPVNAILGAYTLAPFDDAGGHINLHAGYHYHTATGKTKKVEQSDGHAAMIGYAMDGHGLYEHLDSKGQEPKDLDECRGHFDEVRGYHYHVDAAGSNNFINCLSGAYAQ